MSKYWLKLIANCILIIFAFCCIIYNQLIIYGISQGKGQLSIVLNAKPIENILLDPSLPDSLKNKLNLISEIRNYTVDSIAFKPSKNYTTFYNQLNKPILYTISAAEPFKLKAKEWKFPFLGTVSYKGFFNKEKAKREILKLVSEDYDIDVYSPSGWSTLGWFKDPVLSSMLKKTPGSLANIIIHELMHGTLYVKNNVTFNENLANFIGDKGAEKFLLFKYGINSKEYIDYIEDKADNKIYTEYILNSIPLLDSLYNSFTSNHTYHFKKEQKKNIITKIVLGVNRLPLHKKNGYFRYTLQAFKEGNAFFMSFSRYDSQYNFFEKEYTEKYASNLRNYVLHLKTTYSSL
ncbi:MAG: aminopeptidase [Bacteroidia bacterium]